MSAGGNIFHEQAVREWTSIPRSWLFHFAQKTLRLPMVGSTEERK